MNRHLTTALLPAFAGSLTPAAAQSPIDSAAPAGNYEVPPVLKAPSLWGADVLQGEHHKVREEVTTAGFTNTYAIDSDYGVFYAHGDYMLLERIREIYAIAAIRATKESAAYTQAIGAGVAGTVDGAKNLVKDPLGSLSGMGKGAARFLKSATERVATTTQGNDAANNLKKYTEAKRQIAGKYGVDPYTSNQVYQSEVDSVATASTMGNFTVTLASYAIPGGVGIALRGLSTSDKLNEKLVAVGPYDLRVQNKALLQDMGVSDQLTEAFLDHPNLTPRHQTAIATLLGTLTGATGRSEYIRLALAVRSEEDAFFFTLNAALLANYDTHRSKVAAIVDCNGIPAAYTADQHLVLPILLDYGSWTELGSQFIDSFNACTAGNSPIKSRELVISGVLTPRATQELQARGIALTDKAFQTLK